jgi:hypothetical protein
VDLERFCGVTANKKYFRYIKRKLESEGNTVTRHTPPYPVSLLDEVNLHWGAMDYLFRELMFALRAEGFRTYYLGMTGIAGKPGNTIVERAYYQISSHFDWLVHSKGVRQFKDKFEPEWENRYLVYRGNPFSLPKTAIAGTRVL